MYNFIIKHMYIGNTCKDGHNIIVIQKNNK